LSDEPQEKELPDLVESHDKILAIAKKIKTARKLNVFKCPEGEKGCFACKPIESILKGEAEFVGLGGYNRDVYILNSRDEASDSVIL